jgi:hypothetical protein
MATAAAVGFVVVAFMFLFGGATLVYRDVRDRVDDPAHSDEPMKAAF